MGWHTLRHWTERPAFGRLALLAVTLGYGPLAGPVNGLYDRYLLPVLPGVLAVVGYAVRERRATLPVLFAGVLCFDGWSVGWQREYLQRQTAVWQVAETLVAQGIAPTEIDAGYEWDGWYRGATVIEQAHVWACSASAGQPQEGGRRQEGDRPASGE